MSEYEPSQMGVELSDHKPPIEFVFSKTMGDKPFSLAFFAASNPAGPAQLCLMTYSLNIRFFF